MINGRYELIEELGRGGMASIWLARQIGRSGFQKTVAIKKLTEENVSDGDFLKSLTDEARVQVSLRHTNIVEVYDLEIENELPYLIMEYVEGANLKEIIKQSLKSKKPIPTPIACYIVSEICKGLEHAHFRCDVRTGEPLNIIHRDISPANILVSIDGNVKISDFGIAKSALQSSETQVGHIKGKFRYMSPEQAKGQELDHRSDIFSLGLLFYELIVRMPAYDDPHDVKIFSLAQSGIVKIPETIDDALRDILSKALQIDREQRYFHASDFAADIQKYLLLYNQRITNDDVKVYLNGLELDSLKKIPELRAKAENSSSEGDTVVTPVSKKRKIWIPASVAFIAIVIGVVAYQTKTSSLPSPSPVEIAPQLTSGSLKLQAVPDDASISVKVNGKETIVSGKFENSDIPLHTPIDIKVSKVGFIPMKVEVSLTQQSPTFSKEFALKKEAASTVIFDAEPFAEVSIPGKFSKVETPFKESIPPGTYTVTFSHPPSGEKTNTSLIVLGTSKRIICSASFPIVTNEPSKSSCK